MGLKGIKFTTCKECKAIKHTCSFYNQQDYSCTEFMKWQCSRKEIESASKTIILEREKKNKLNQNLNMSITDKRKSWWGINLAMIVMLVKSCNSNIASFILHMLKLKFNCSPLRTSLAICRDCGVGMLLFIIYSIKHYVLNKNFLLTESKNNI